MRLPVLIAVVLALTVPASAVEDLDEQYRGIQGRIREQERRIREARDLESSFLSQIDAANQQLDDTRRDLRVQAAKIARMREKIVFVKGDIATFRMRLDKQRAYLKRKLTSMQRYGNDMTNIVSAVVSSRSFAEMLRTMRYLRKVAEYDFKQINIFKDNLRTLDRKKKELDALYVQLKDEESELKAREERLSAERRHKEILLASIRKQQDGYRKLLGELNEASQRLQEMLERQKTVETTQLGKFALLKGRLPWPVEGAVAIPYGSYRDPQFNTPVFRRGIYIRAEEGTVAKAVHQGTVAYADWFKGYGKVIILNHGGGYHSVYANLSEIFFRAGESVRKRDALGRVGDSGTIDVPALYFEMRYKGKPLNPLQWLDARKK